MSHHETTNFILLFPGVVKCQGAQEEEKGEGKTEKMVRGWRPRVFRARLDLGILFAGLAQYDLSLGKCSARPRLLREQNV